MFQKSLGHMLAGFGAHGSKARRKSDSTWITGTFDPNGQTFAARYGFTLEETNGSPVGERGPSDDLQSVIQHPDNPFMIENNATYQIRTYWDVCDCRYVMVGELTAWDKIIKPVLDKYQVTQPGSGGSGADPCAKQLAQIKALEAALTLLQTEVGGLEQDLAAAQTLADNVAKVVKNLNIPVRGGGVAWNGIRKIKGLLEV